LIKKPGHQSHCQFEIRDLKYEIISSRATGN
jgi:hypothetical protein